MKNKKPLKNDPTVKIDRAIIDQVDYWQRKAGFKSRKDFVSEAIRQYIALKNGDYQLPNAEIQRINQLIMAMNAQTVEIKTLKKAVDSGFSALYNLTDDSIDI